MTSETQPVKLVGYFRTSTDDKNQNPDRQREVVERWAAAQDYILVGFVTDEGTSGATPVQERRKLRDAIRRAKEMGAQGLVCESVDRFTRSGNDAEVQGRVWLQLTHGLDIYYADLPAGMPPFVEEMVRSIYATMGKMFREQLRERIKQGNARAAMAGWPNGKPGPKAKHSMSDAEWDEFDRLKAQGKGFRAIAQAISDQRGAFEVYDPKARRERLVSESWIRKQAIARVASQANATRDAPSLRVATRRNDDDGTVA